MTLHRVKEHANKTDIVNSYRKLAREWHPDKNKHRAEQAQKEFSAIAHAYEILRNDLSRRDYDYALRHPELFAYNQAKYFYTQFYSRHVKVCCLLAMRFSQCNAQRRSLTHISVQFNPILVLLVALSAWSAFDYSARMMSHKRAVRIYKDSPEYKIALKRFKEEKVLCPRPCTVLH
jgi:curved DNA-binding protein CbpA